METAQTIQPDQTAFAASDCLLPIEEYGLKWGISRRTTDRYVKNGRVRMIKKAGRTFCIDTEPKPAMDKPDMPSFSDRQSDTSFDLPVKADWIRFGVISNQARQANVYKILTASLTVLVIAIVSIAVYWFVKLDRQGIADTYLIKGLESTLARTEAARIAAEKTVAVEKTRHAATVGGLTRDLAAARQQVIDQADHKPASENEPVAKSR